MFGLASKKEMWREFDKIGEAFKELRNKNEANALKIATLEGILLNKSQVSQVSQVSQSLPVSSSLKPKTETFETKLIKRIKTNKKALVMSEIMKLSETTPTNDLFNIIVLERGLCSKASFYRYIDSLKSQGYETNKETIETTIKHKHK